MSVYRTPTTQDRNIPDPPDGADPQMAAGFIPGSAMTTFAQMVHPDTVGTAPGISAPGAVTRPSSSVQYSVFSR